MSSSSKPARARVMRGAATLEMRRMPFEVDLTTSSPLASVDRAQVDKAAAEGHRAGFEAGRTEGYEAGLAAARRAVDDETRDRVSALEAATQALAAALRETVDARTLAFHDLEDEVTAAAFTIAEAVLDRELAVAKAPGREAVARALALAPSGDALVRLHPDDMATVGKLQTGRILTLIADPGIERGGAVVEVGACTIDAQLGSAMTRVRKALAR